jgi:hypothetical protein
VKERDDNKKGKIVCRRAEKIFTVTKFEKEFCTQSIGVDTMKQRVTKKAENGLCTN